MFKIEALKAFLLEHTPPGYAYSYNRMPDAPDDMITLTEVPGIVSGDVEEAFEIAAFQMKVRSKRATPIATRDTIHTLDRVILNDALRPFFLAGSLVTRAGRVGGKPVYFSTDHQGRTVYLCNYWLEIARD